LIRAIRGNRTGLNKLPPVAGFDLGLIKRRPFVVEKNLYDCLLEVVKKRRSIRYFKTDPVPDEFVDRIIEVARWAPSGFHTQPWEFVVIKKKEIKDKIVQAITGHAPPSPAAGKAGTAPATGPGRYSDAPVFILLLGDTRARAGLPDAVKNNDKRAEEIMCSSLASTFLYMHLAAAALGLASQWYSAVGWGKTEQAVKTIIGIPETIKIYDMMVVGYSAQPPVPKELRRHKDMVHYDDCGLEDFRSDEKVAADAQKSKTWCINAH
jgi:nitroreductase